MLKNVLFFITMYSMVFADADIDSLKVYEMRDSIVVVANRYQSSIKNLAYSYDVIPKEQVQNLALHSALEVVDIHFPSAFMFEKKVMGFGVGPEGSGQIYLRGQGGQPNTGVLVLLNGHPDFMGIFGHPLPDVYGTDNIEQAEIMAGPASTVFGSNAMGGVINLVTSPDFNHPLRISLEGGSFGSYNLGLNANQQFGNHGAFLSLRRKYSEGHLDQTGFESYHLQAGWQYQINSIWNVSASGRYVPYSFDDPSRASRDTLGIGTYAEIKRSTGEIRFENKSNDLQGSLQLYTNRGNHKFYDGFESNDFTYGLSVYQHWKSRKTFSIAAGMDIIHYGGKAKNTFAYLPNGMPSVNEDQQRLSTAGAYMLAFYNPVRIVNVKAGIRYQYNSLPLNAVSPVLGVTLSPLKKFSLYANYQTGFTFPTLRDLYLFPSANENLEEQEITSTELGAKYFINSRDFLQLSLFRNDANNLIQALPNVSPPPLVTFQNSGEAIQYGIESKLRLRPINRFGIQVSHSYLDPDNLTAFNPQHQIKYLLTASWQQLNLSIHGKCVHGLYAGNKRSAKLPDYQVVNFSLTTGINNVGLSLRLINLFDEDYKVLPTYEAPGFHVMGGISYQLEP